MKTRFPLLAAIGIVIVWGVMYLAIPLTMDAFKDFKIEMPGLTMMLIQAHYLKRGLALPMLVLLVALLLRYRQVSGWILALAFCVACDFAFVGLVLPSIALANNLSGADDGSTASLRNGAAWSTPGLWLGVVAVFLNQILFALLLQKRREFLVVLTVEDSLLPIK